MGLPAIRGEKRGNTFARGPVTPKDTEMKKVVRALGKTLLNRAQKKNHGN